MRHFAGDVVYCSTDFVERNTDQFFHDLKRMLCGRVGGFFCFFFGNGLAVGAGRGGAGTAARCRA